ncbi:hypothetical protein SteCoe_29578 [Stentor coeruleus]|uniref:PX domain-containing protein n=1 Tax=Stentor coeruleus TaxID=5963 RepID=A0A1R2B5K8_9CILI|nr:hypothetical protein SteCoe_29578 [Stentor coeruleus]
MDSAPEIYVPSTLSKSGKSIFSASFTLYEIRVKLAPNCEIIAFKRYSELLNFSEKLFPQIREERIFLPKFPGKKLNKLNESLILQRRIELEQWLKSAISHKSLQDKILTFLDYVITPLNLNSKAKTSPDELLILEFVEKISKDAQNKMKLIENFSWNFFQKKRTVQQNYISQLTECLVPLCGCEFVGSKALDVLSKLTTSDYFRDFVLVCRVLTSFPPRILKKMCLNEYLTKKRFSDSQLQAYNLCKTIQDSLSNIELIEILNHDDEALVIFHNWGQEAVQESPRNIVVRIQDWRPIIETKDLDFKFRFIGKDLEISGIITAEATVSRIIDILTVPSERKKWDIRLVDMKPIAEIQGFSFTYLAERTLYEFHTAMKKTQTNSLATIEFQTTCYMFKQPNSVLGRFNSCYIIEQCDDQVSSTKDSEEKLFLNSNESKSSSKVKINLNSHYCEASYHLVRGDLFQEADTMRKSFELFIDIAEYREDRIKTPQSVDNPILQAFERKKLGRAKSMIIGADDY